MARRYQGSSGKYEIKVFARADDYADSAHEAVLAYYEAMHAHLPGGHASACRLRATQHSRNSRQ
jgi:hypothetical protein